MEFDALLLSRIQFGFTISFHIIFPAFTIGLASWLLALEFNWLRTGDALYRNLFRFWSKIFAVSFGARRRVRHRHELPVRHELVAVLGIRRQRDRTRHPVRGITAFFLEAAFLGIMLFGWEKVGDRLHFFATCMVALGTLSPLSGSSPPIPGCRRRPASRSRTARRCRWIGSGRLQSVLPLALRAYGDGLLPHDGFCGRGHVGLDAAAPSYDAPEAKLAGSRRSLSMALWFAAIFVPVQIVIGDLHGLGVLKYQPTKLAAIEGNWDRMDNMPLRLFAIPDEVAETNRFEIGSRRSAAGF